MLDMLLFALAIVGVVFVFAYLWDLSTEERVGEFPVTQFLFLVALFLLCLREAVSFIIEAKGAPAFDVLYDLLDVISMISIIIAFGMHLWKGEEKKEPLG